MRDIRFRAWDGKEMHKNVVIVDGIASKRGYFSTPFLDQANAGTPMQFTGLKDKNGKEIYEGDLVEFLGETHKIKWFSGSFWSVNINDDVTHMVYGHRCEVIGNVYEDAHLIKKAD